MNGLKVLLVCLLVGVISAEEIRLSAFLQNDQWVTKEGHHENAAATAAFIPSINETGWAKLNLSFADRTIYSAEEQMKAAGYLEGVLTWNLIWDYYQNMYQDLFGNYTTEQLQPVFDFVQKNDQWALQQIENRDPTDIYWNTVALLYAQLEGIIQGQNIGASAKNGVQMTRLQVILVNLDGDLFDIIPAFIPSMAPYRTPAFTGHCTSFVRFTGEDLFCAHNTWDSFQTMLRIFKRYDFQVPGLTNNLLFSSYPGTLCSMDDFYVLGSGLFVTETTNGNFNQSLFSRLTPTGVLFSWVRAMTANFLANSAPEWGKLYANHNSGTYNNQWVAVDHNLFTPGMTQLAPNTVWVIEQIPGFVELDDQTDFVNQHGYWAGYNVPYYPYIFNIMGYPGAIQQQGQEFSWTNCSRANIFRRDAQKVITMDDMKRTMQYNDYQNDPYSTGNPCNSIASRCDLATVAQGQGANGALDAKITNHEMLQNLQCFAISGPTHQNQPVFTWSNPLWKNENHFGQPETFDFDWQLMQ